MNDMVSRRALSIFPALCLALALWLRPFDVVAQVPQGVFTLSAADKVAQQSALDNRDVVGLSIRAGWAALEPSEGVFNWSYLDSEIARATAAGKVVMLRISTQSGKPQWVTDAIKQAGGKFFNYDNNGETGSFALYWDPTFLAKKKAMIAAVGARYGGNPNIKIVSASFANGTSEDWSVPHETADVTQWLSLGYTTDKLVDAGKQMIDAVMTAFPNAYVTVAMNGNGYTGKGPNLDPDSNYVPRTVTANANASWPGRFIAQKNSLSTFNPVAPGTNSNWEVLWNNRPNVGAQMLYWCANETSYRMNGGVPGDPATVLRKAIDAGLSYGLSFLEIYQTDVINLPGEIAYAHGKLVGQPPTPPTPTPSASPTPPPAGAPAPPVGLRVVK
ncbi:hypothetical protein BH20VER3_BH20VER3_18680 [soil metagenome]